MSPEDIVIVEKKLGELELKCIQHAKESRNEALAVVSALALLAALLSYVGIQGLATSAAQSAVDQKIDPAMSLRLAEVSGNAARVKAARESAETLLKAMPKALTLVESWTNPSTSEQEVSHEFELKDEGLLIASAYGYNRRSETAVDDVEIILSILDNDDDCSKEKNLTRQADVHMFASATCTMRLTRGKHKITARRVDTHARGQNLRLSVLIFGIPPSGKPN